jgi:hypothetical protein
VRFVLYALVLLLALEVAIGECFLVAARPLGHPWPVAALAAVVGNVLLGVAGARALGRAGGSAGPGLIWLGVVLTLGSGPVGGDRVVPNSGRGVAFRVAGAAAAAAVVALTTAAASGRKNGTTPEGHLRR